MTFFDSVLSQKRNEQQNFSTPSEWKAYIGEPLLPRWDAIDVMQYWTEKRENP